MPPDNTPSPQLTDAERLRRTRARLKRASASLTRIETRLRALHDDDSGTAWACYRTYPLIPDECKGSEKSIRRTQAEAQEGCSLCRDWLRDTAEQRERIDTLRNTSLPKKHKNYRGLGLTWAQVRRLGKPKVRTGCVPMTEAEVAAHFAECTRRHARGSRRPLARVSRDI